MSSGKKIDKILAIDCETSGLNWESGKSHCPHGVAHGYQAVSWGMVISDTETFKPIDELYVEIKWNGESKWDSDAEKIHGMSKEYLEENGVDEEEAIIQIIEFIMKHMDIKKPIYCLGHNVATFDVPFFKDLLYRNGIEGIKFGHRHFDSFSLSMGTVKMHDSDTLFHKVGLPARKDHNSLEDAKCALESYRRISKAWQAMMAATSSK